MLARTCLLLFALGAPSQRDARAADGREAKTAPPGSSGAAAATTSTPEPARETPNAAHPEVVVLVNGASPISIAIGEYYRARRGIPPENLLRLEIPLQDPSLAGDESESISRADYVRRVRDPVRAFLRAHANRDAITTLVTTKGVPLHYTWTVHPMPRWLVESPNASIEAELAILWSDRDGNAGIAGMTNPYFGSARSFADFRAAHGDGLLSYVTARLDGHAGNLDPASGVPADVKRLIDAAQASGPRGKTLVDEDPGKAPAFLPGNRLLLRPIVAMLRGMGLEVRHEATTLFVGNARDLAAYASWGSNDDHDAGAPFYGSIAGVTYPGRFGPRAIAVDLVSTNARTFTKPPKHYEQSLIADLIPLGIAGAAGYVTEPVLSGCARPYTVLRRFAEGVPAGEAHLRAVPWLGWTNVWIGDPLMTVERPATRRSADLDGDGVPDATDDCMELADPDQRDTDGDGFGNLCDPDVDQDGIVTARGIGGRTGEGDLERIARIASIGGYDPTLDLDGDHRVDTTDVGIAQLWLLLPPGPSGRTP